MTETATRTHETAAHDPGLDHLLEEVAVEVLRQDAIRHPVDVMRHRGSDGYLRALAVTQAAQAVRSVRAIDQAAGGEH